MNTGPSGLSDVVAAQQRNIAQLVRRVLPGLARRVGTGAEGLRRGIKKLEIRMAAFERTVLVKPVVDIPFPKLDLANCDDPIVAIMAAPEFAAATAFFADNPVVARSLETPVAHALLYCLIRNLRPDNVVEIGTYRAGTTESICRALCANGHGTAHTVDPFTGDYAEVVLKSWPPELLQHVKLYTMNSMTFTMEMRRQKLRPDLVFVDGEHDYEFAMFDIGAAARNIAPGGFLFIDNIDQAGPFMAAYDFLSVNPGWRELGSSLRDYSADRAFDRRRSMIPATQFIALQAPRTYPVDRRPRGLGLVRQSNSSVSGLRLQAQRPNGPGQLIVQVVLRGFGAERPLEVAAETTIELQPGMANQSFTAAFTPPLQLANGCVYYTVEPWLIWRGEEPLQLLQLPEPY